MRVSDNKKTALAVTAEAVFVINIYLSVYYSQKNQITKVEI